jgi:hypothetical protein
MMVPPFLSLRTLSLVDNNLVEVGLVLAGVLAEVYGAKLEEAEALVLGSRPGAADARRTPVDGRGACC